MTHVWHAISSWFGSVDWNFWGVWTVTSLLLLAGWIGSFLPLVPGPLLIFVGCAWHSWLRPRSGLGLWGILLELLFVVGAYVLDFSSGAMGSKWFGGSRWGIVGVFLGGLVGIFFSLPGLILGPIIGGLLFELAFAGKAIRPAIKATWGSVLGTGLGLLGRGLIGTLMVAYFMIRAIWR